MSAEPPPSIAIIDADLDDRRVDVVLRDGRITSITPAGTAVEIADLTIDAGGGALLPGLHDHHLHLLAMAAARSSVDVADRDLDRAVAGAHASTPAGEWLRVVGYDETVAGALDRDRLDRLAPNRPVRVQHRSGAMWVLSSTALAGIDLDAAPDGVERDDRGRPTGRLFRLDQWLADQVPRRAAPDLTPVGADLVARGITGVTDATPSRDPADFDLLARAVRGGALPLSVVVTGGPALAGTAPPHPLTAGPVKVVIADHDLPPLDEVESWFRAAHLAGRSVAVHCVTDIALVLALAAWDAVGARPGDRVEHGSVVHPVHRERLRRLGLTVVTQPGFLHRSGDRYLAEVDGRDLPYLYPCASLLGAGVEVGGSSDAPFGPIDPWLAMATAVDRRSSSGRAVGLDERVAPRRALDLYLADRDRPGGPPRQPAPGGPGDLCVLDRPLDRALADLGAVDVVATIAAGTVVHRS